MKRALIGFIVVILLAVVIYLKPDDIPVEGVLNPDVTEATLAITVCVPGWTATVRPSVSYTNALKTRQLEVAGIATSTFGWRNTGKDATMTIAWKYDKNGSYSIDYDKTKIKPVLVSLLGNYEEDHAIPLVLGGHPTSTDNLYPQAYPEAREKDKVEQMLHRKLCVGEITLSQAQDMVRNWKSYRLSPKLGGVDEEIYDDDDN